MTDGNRAKPTDERFRSAKLKQVILEIDGEVSVWERWVPDDELPPAALCGSCGINTVPEGQPSEWYMVDDQVWEEVTRTDVDCRYLCVGCLERRLGRKLSAADFADALCNRPSPNDTVRLATRKRSEVPRPK